VTRCLAQGSARRWSVIADEIHAGSPTTRPSQRASHRRCTDLSTVGVGTPPGRHVDSPAVRCGWRVAAPPRVVARGSRNDHLPPLRLVAWAHESAGHSTVAVSWVFGQRLLYCDGLFATHTIRAHWRPAHWGPHSGFGPPSALTARPPIRSTSTNILPFSPFPRPFTLDTVRHALAPCPSFTRSLPCFSAPQGGWTTYPFRRRALQGGGA
jgi:hypothetical protein